MDTKTKLKRFCFLGSFEPVYTHLSGTLNVEIYWPIVEKLVVALDAAVFVPLMREVLHEVPLVRRDEPIFVYAAYLAADVKIEEKTLVREAFPVLIRNDDDLFLFCKYTALIGTIKKQKCFSQTVRKALKSWYELQTPETIRTMWLAHRGLHGFTHKTLIKLCHISDQTMGASDVATPFFLTCTILLKETETIKIENKPTIYILPTRTSNKKSEAKAIDSNANAKQTETVQTPGNVPSTQESVDESNANANIMQTDAEAPSNVPPIQESVDESNANANTMETDADVEVPSNVPTQESVDESNPNANTMETDADAVVPSNVLTQESVDESTTNANKMPTDAQAKSKKKPKQKKTAEKPAPIILEPAKGSDLVVAISKLRTTRKMNEAIKIVRKYKLPYTQVPGHWQRNHVIMETCLHSMSYLQILKSWRKMARNNHFEENSRIFKLCKRMLENKEFARKCRIHPIHLLMFRNEMGNLEKLPTKTVEALKLDYLTKLYKDSFHWHPDSGKLRMCITVNLQTNYKKKFLKNQKKLNYYDACVALAFGYAKREAKVDIFHWVEEKTQLKQILFDKNYTTQMGFNSYDVVVNHKNNQRLVTPLMNALNSAQVYDVFLCIVPTAGRGNPKNNSDFICKFLDRYRENKNSKARFIILNLLKFKRSMQYSEMRAENILEICGLDEHTTDIIQNFATHRFF